MRSCLLIVLLLILTGCVRDETDSNTSTIAPAEARPGEATDFFTTAKPVFTTAGSPPPSGGRFAAMEQLTITDGRVSVRPLLPRMHTVFRVRNDGTQPHALHIAGPGRPGQSFEPLAPGAEVILQIELLRGQYTLRCPLPGHDEHAEFSTYEPGTEQRRRER